MNATYLAARGSIKATWNNRMDRHKAIRLIRSGRQGLSEWNEWRRERAADELPDFRGANLTDGEFDRVDLSKADLADADLRGSSLCSANLSDANLQGANLSGADLTGASLAGANLSHAELNGSCLQHATLRGAKLKGAMLHGAKLVESNFIAADLSEADLTESLVIGANFFLANLQKVKLVGSELLAVNFDSSLLTKTDFTGSSLGALCLGNLDISSCIGLKSVTHEKPSTIGVNTLIKSRGRIPESFLGGCGLPDSIISFFSSHQSVETMPHNSDEIFRSRTGADLINGCFISYSWSDAKFVDKLHDRLKRVGINIWLDRHDAVAGPLQEQIWQAIQSNHAAILVLSESSIKSDWVENELEMARAKEIREGRSVLCPIAIDSSWISKLDTSLSPGDHSRALWLTVKKKNILDFSAWRTKAFNKSFDKLINGLKTHYIRLPD